MVALRSEEWAFDDPRPCHTPLPHELAIEVDLRPEREPGYEVG